MLEEAGYEGFTIAAVCERAQVSPRAVYDRAPSKDALFRAVYERGMARIKADLRPIAAQITHPGTDVDTVLRTWFTTVFSALVIRVAYGAGFAPDPRRCYLHQPARPDELRVSPQRAPARGPVILAPTRPASSRSHRWPASWVWTGCHHSASWTGTASKGQSSSRHSPNGAGCLVRDNDFEFFIHRAGLEEMPWLPSQDS